jgi:hypothetical protein
VTAGPYPPSWQERFFRSVRRLGAPRLLVFLGISLAWATLNHLVPWLEGRLPFGELDPHQATFQVWMPVVLLAGDYFLDAAGPAMDAFRPALGMDDATFERERYAFATVPARTGWFITAAALVFSVGGLSFGRPYQQAGLSAVALFLTEAFMFGLVFWFMYFLFRTVRRAAALYGRVGEVAIFHLDPLYAFSALTARIGMFLAFAGALSYLTNIALVETPNTVGFVFFAGIDLTVAIAAFLYPLLGIHRRLETAKEAAADANDLRLEAAYRELHRRSDALEIAGMADLRHQIEAILEFRREIAAISTWPWAPGTIRAFLSAILLPIGLWLTQQVLERILAT